MENELSETCPRCGIHLRYSSLVGFHLLREPITCKWCPQIFCDRIDFENHDKIHTRMKSSRRFCSERQQPIQCSTSQIAFPQAGNSKGDHGIHSIANILKTSFYCEICKKSFPSKSHLKYHNRYHADKRFPCNLCDNSFHYISQLSIHLRTHTGVRPFKCTICDKGFPSKTNLTLHMEIHTRPFKCTFCDKSFYQMAQLTKHWRFHTEERPFQCITCHKTFSQRKNMEQHVKIHQREALFK